MHGGGGVGKSCVASKLKESLSRINKKILCTCPTGNGAALFSEGVAFHSAFKALVKNPSSKLLSVMSRKLDKRTLVAAIGEVSTLSVECLEMIDDSLLSECNSKKVFGRVSILLSSDFLQTKRVDSAELCKVLS